jgi:hypothetical protein
VSRTLEDQQKQKGIEQAARFVAVHGACPPG